MTAIAISLVYFQTCSFQNSDSQLFQKNFPFENYYVYSTYTYLQIATAAL